MAAIDRTDVVARALANPRTWVPHLFDTDPDLCDDKPVAAGGSLFISGVRVADPLEAVIFAGEAETREDAAQWIAEHLGLAEERARQRALDGTVAEPVAPETRSVATG